MSELSVRLIEGLVDKKPVSVENCLPVELIRRGTA